MGGSNTAAARVAGRRTTALLAGSALSLLDCLLWRSLAGTARAFSGNVHPCRLAAAELEGQSGAYLADCKVGP